MSNKLIAKTQFYQKTITEALRYALSTNTYYLLCDGVFLVQNKFCCSLEHLKQSPNKYLPIKYFSMSQSHFHNFWERYFLPLPNNLTH